MPAASGGATASAPCRSIRSRRKRWKWPAAWQRRARHPAHAERKSSINRRSTNSTPSSKAFARQKRMSTLSPTSMSSRKPARGSSNSPGYRQRPGRHELRRRSRSRASNRGHQLQKGQSLWLTEPGRKVLGYYSELDGSVQPMGVTIPDGYDATKPDRLYVGCTAAANGMVGSQLHQWLQKRAEVPEHSLSRQTLANSLSIAMRGKREHQAAKSMSSKASRPCSAVFQSRSRTNHSSRLLAPVAPPLAYALQFRIAGLPRIGRARIPPSVYAGNAVPPYQKGRLHIYENIIDWASTLITFACGHDGDADDQ